MSSLLTTATLGCSLITDLDFVGGHPSQSAAGAGTAGAVIGAGGTENVTAATGGDTAGVAGSTGGCTSALDAGAVGIAAMGCGQGGTTDGPSSAGEGGQGGEGADAGMGGENGGEAGIAGENSGGTGAGGSGSGGAGQSGSSSGPAGGGSGGAGNAGAGSGGAGSGGSAGIAGNQGCAGANLQTDTENCGRCGTVCDENEPCLAGVCVSSPCEGLCDDWTVVPRAASDEFKADKVGTRARCFEVTGTTPPATGTGKIKCWGVVPTRPLQVNGIRIPSDGANNCDRPLPAPRAGGYCVQLADGDFDWAGFTIPD